MSPEALLLRLEQAIACALEGSSANQASSVDQDFSVMYLTGSMPLGIGLNASFGLTP